MYSIEDFFKERIAIDITTEEEFYIFYEMMTDYLGKVPYYQSGNKLEAPEIRIFTIHNLYANVRNGLWLTDTEWTKEHDREVVRIYEIEDLAVNDFSINPLLDMLEEL